MSDAEAAAKYTRDFERVREEERQWLRARREAEGLPEPDGDEVGLAFSGGGIRSAVFNLGVLEALESTGLMRRVDYLSSVSGGGYIACAYSWLRAQLPRGAGPTFAAPLAKGHGTALDWLRRHVQYLIAQKGFSIMTLLASIFAAVFLNVLVLTAPLIAITDVMTLQFLHLEWPQLHELWPLPPAHDGYLLLCAASLACFAAWPLLAMYFAMVATRYGLHAPEKVDRMRVALGVLLTIGAVLMVIGLIPVTAHWIDLALARWGPSSMQGDGASLTSIGAVVSGLAAFWRGQSKGTLNGQRLARVALALLVYGIFVLAYAVAAHIDTLRSQSFLALLAISLLLGTWCSLNAVSIHSYYRDRLRQAMMLIVAAKPEANPGNFRCSDVLPATGAPFHLICSTLNTKTSPDERRRAREGACFAFTPLRFGSTATGWGDAFDNEDSDARVATATAIAGAAVDPDSPQTKNRSLSFLMALLNLRLGYWAINPNPMAWRALPLPGWWTKIFRELLGTRLDERWRDIHLSDGGQFENLGVYELIRRRVPYIISVDAGSDPTASYADLGNMIEKVRVDFGAQVRLTLRADEAVRPWRLGEILYADGSRGLLLYFKACMHGAVSADVLAYQRKSPSFPNEPTSNQFFTEAQFEAYRWLARETVLAALQGQRYEGIAQWFETLRLAGSEAPPALAPA